MKFRYLVLLGTVISSFVYFSPLKAHALISDNFDYTFDATYICGHASTTVATSAGLGNYWCTYPQFKPVPANDFYAIPIKTTSTLNTLMYYNNNVFGGTGTTSLIVVRNSSSGTVISTTSIGAVQFNVAAPQRQTFENLGLQFDKGDHIALAYNNTGTVNATNLSAGATLFFTETSTLTVTFTSSSTDTFMSTSTDAIVGNTFNQIYLIIWLLFFLFIFYISYRIAGGLKLFKK